MRRIQNSKAQWKAIYNFCADNNLSLNQLECRLKDKGSILKTDSVRDLAEYVKEESYQDIYNFLDFEINYGRQKQ